MNQRRIPVSRYRGSAAFLGAALLTACGGGGSDPAPSETPSPAPGTVTQQVGATACTSLSGRTFAAATLGEPSSGATVTSASYVSATPDTINAAGTSITKALPNFCRVLIDVAPRDPAAPVTKVQVNLPTEWNGKKLQFGGSGFNGSLITGLTPARVAPPDVPLPITRGYLTAGTDSGHQNAAGVEAQAFALNEEAMRNYGYASYKNTHDLAVQLATAYYGSRPKNSYYMGGSEGGREAMMMAQRYPADFDGIFALDPVMNFTALQTFGNRIGGERQLGAAWLAPKVTLLHNTVMAACDALDGLTDQVVNNYLGCKAPADAAITAARCPSGADEGPTCFSDAQLGAVRSAYAGYTFNFALANGMTSYAGLGYGSEGLNWPRLVGTIPPEFSGSSNVSGVNQMFAFGNGFVRYFIAQDASFQPLTYSPDAFQARNVLVSEIMDATNPDLSAFMRRGGKLILRESMNDSAQSPYTGLNYYDAVKTRMGTSTVDTFFRAYAGPGLGHTNEGIAASTTPNLAPAYGVPSRVDWLDYLDKWVTTNAAPPDFVVATIGQQVPPYAITASKPHCRYPLYPHYVGTGANGGALASNYVCRQ